MLSEFIKQRGNCQYQNDINNSDDGCIRQVSLNDDQGTCHYCDYKSYRYIVIIYLVSVYKLPFILFVGMVLVREPTRFADFVFFLLENMGSNDLFHVFGHRYPLYSFYPCYLPAFIAIVSASLQGALRSSHECCKRSRSSAPWHQIFPSFSIHTETVQIPS